jgi:hypothetical protein
MLILRSKLRLPSLSTVTGSASAPGEDEVERKFRPTPGMRAQLAQLGAPSKLSEFTDRYYDESSFRLTRKDCWLRRRDKAWELKSPQSPQSPSERCTEGASALVGVDYYRESRDWPTIASIAEVLAGVRLAAPFPADVEGAEAWLASRGLALFANVRTSRERSTLQLARGHQVRVDLDNVAFFSTNDNGAGPAVLSRYEIGEVELVAAGGGATPAEALADAFGQLGISAEPVRGKLLELLSRHRPNHYEALRESGLLEAKLGPGKG